MKVLVNNSEADFPFNKRSIPFWTFEATIGNQAFGIDDAFFFGGGGLGLGRNCILIITRN